MTTESLATPETPSPQLQVRYRPRVDLLSSEFGFVIGDYRFLFYSTGLRSQGTINYKYLIGVLAPDELDVLYLTAETNDMEGDSVIYLGRFDLHHRATITQSPALAHAEFFTAVACMIAREALDLPYERYPVTEAEDLALGAIPEILRQRYPQGTYDNETQMLINRLVEGVARSA